MADAIGGSTAKAMQMVFATPIAAAKSKADAAAAAAAVPAVPDTYGDGSLLGRPKRQRNSLAANALIPSENVSRKQLLGQ